MIVSQQRVWPVYWWVFPRSLALSIHLNYLVRGHELAFKNTQTQHPNFCFCPGPCHQDTIQQCVPARVHIPGLVLQDIWVSWLSSWCGSNHHLPRSFELPLRPLCDGHIWLHFREPAAWHLHERHTFLLLVSRNSSMKYEYK